MIRLHIRGLNQVLRKNEGRRRKAKDMRPLHKMAVIKLFQFVQQNFELQGRLVGGWTPLHHSTVARRRTAGGRGNPMILQDSGALRSRWNLIHNRQRGVLRSMVRYAADHHFGRGNKPPRRALLPTRQQAQRLLKPIFKRHVRVIVK